MRRRAPDPRSPSPWAGLIPAALAAVVVYAAVVPATRPIVDPDVFFHLRAGEWILEHRGLPGADPFSRIGTEDGRAWAVYSWLFDVLVAVLFRMAGWTGVLLYTAAVSGAIAALLFSLALRYEQRRPVAAALAVVGILALWPMFTARPWLLTVLFFLLELRILLGFREQGRRRDLLWLIPLFAIWANLHIQFVYGLLLIGVFAGEPLVAPVLRWIGRARDPEALSRKHREAARLGPDPRTTPHVTWYVLAGLAAALACLANPYRAGLVKVILDYATQSVPLRGVQELTPPDFTSLSEWLAALLVVAGLLAWGFRGLRSPLPLLVLMVGAFLFLRMRRDIWFAAIAGVMVLSMSRPGLGPAALRGEEDAEDGDGLRAGEAALRRWGWRYRTGVAVAVILMLGAGGRWAHFRPGFHEERIALRYPVEAARFVESGLHTSRDGRIRGPLFNPFDWGGYLIWALPEVPVSMDGRTNLHGPERIRRSWNTWDGKEGWARDPELLASNLVIADPELALSTLLDASPVFERVFGDSADAAWVFLRTLPGPADAFDPTAPVVDPSIAP